MTAPYPDEQSRLAALHGLAVLDTPSEPAFDDIVRRAAEVCGAPVGLLSLVDRDRQYFKARFGTELVETPRAGSFCNQAILGNDLFVVSDAAGDPRFAAHPMVAAPPGIRFYAGVPLSTPEGASVGTLCVIDWQPRTLDASQKSALRVLGGEATRLLVERRDALLRERVLDLVDTELRDALHAIAVNAGRLMLSGKGGPRAAELVESSERARAVVDDLADYIRTFLIGEVPLKLAPVDAHVLCRDLVTELAGEREIGFVLEGNGKGRWDADRLSQVLASLLGLTIDRSPDSATIGLHLREVGGQQVFEIRSSSAFLSEAERKSVFQPLASGPLGSSVALAIARSVIVAHGGRLDLRSDDAGMSFVIVLPRLLLDA